MRTLALACVGFALATAPVAAQTQPPLGDVLDSLAALWARGDAAAIVALTSDEGVDIEVAGIAMGSISGRKLSAVLRRLFEDRTTVEVEFLTTAPVQGVEDRAFGELRWTLRPGGATVPERTTVFLALVHERAGWRVTQIRILE